MSALIYSRLVMKKELCLREIINKYIMKNVNLLSLVFLSFILLSSCSSEDDSENDQSETLSNEPLTGEVYGQSFSAEGGTADFITVNSLEVISIALYNQAVACDNNEESWIILNVPREVGMHDLQVTGGIKDPDSDDFLSLTNIKVEVVSFNNETVVAKALINRPSINSFVNGAFEIQVCFSGEE